MARARTQGGPLTDTERLAKIRTKEEHCRKLRQEAIDARKAAKAAEKVADEAEAEVFAEIRDEPEGDLGYRDEED